ncbi:Hypothetical protein, putative, partial [Bodo saltans]
MNATRAGCIILVFVGIVAWIALVPSTNEDKVGIAAPDVLVTETTFIHSNHEFSDNGKDLFTTKPPIMSSVAYRRLPRQQSASWTPSAALRAFEGTCLNELPALFESSRLKKTVLWTSMKQWVMYEPRTVCVTPEAHVLYFSSESGGGLPNRMFERHIRGDRNTRVDYEAPRAMFNGNLSLLLQSLKAAQTNGSLSWHNSLGVIMASRLDQHPYHFLLDEALQALSVLTNPDDPISSNPFEPIRISDALLSVVRKDDDDRPMWPVTLAMVPPLMMMPLANISFNDEKRQLVMIDGNGASDGKTHCYCQAVVLHGHYERDRNRFLDPRACEKDPSDGPCQMFLVLRKRLQRHFGLVPFGETAPLASFQRFGFWPNVTNVSTPRLLMGLRNVRFLAQANEIEAMARELGFATQRIYFEEHSYEAQFTAMRSADVFLSVHGAAFAWTLFLDTLGPNAFCRSMIEMMVPIREELIPFHIHEATLGNMSFFRVRNPIPKFLSSRKKIVGVKKDRN